MLMRRRALLLAALLRAGAVSAEEVPGDHGLEAAGNDNADADSAGGGWSWAAILASPIVGGGNAWPPRADEAAGDCVVLVTHNLVLRHCPTVAANGADAAEDTVVIHRRRGTPGRYRGAFRGMGSADDAGRGQRLWLLDSPYRAEDVLREVDTLTGEVVQTLAVSTIAVSGGSPRRGCGKQTIAWGL